MGFDFVDVFVLIVCELFICFGLHCWCWFGSDLFALQGCLWVGVVVCCFSWVVCLLCLTCCFWDTLLLYECYLIC